ncbi:MAG TPA: hypothetical protein VL326_36465 [Kofleriaceae bacterium]|nr:hypothetical protein [Kofleriaceae bacterium]
MRRAGVLAVLLLGGCGDDPSLHVVVEHPDGLAVVTTSVTVYESPTLKCVDVAFRRISDADLVPLVVAEDSVIYHGVGDLSGISRVDHKVIVARGFDVMGEPLTAGCAEQEIVEGRTTVEIKTKELVTVSLVAPDPTDNTDPLRAIVAATDSKGQGVDGRRVGWTVFGPAGATPSPSSAVTLQSFDQASWIPDKPACTQNGPASVHPVPPSQIGGYAVQIGVEWAKSLPPIYTNLTSARLDAFPEHVTPPASATSKSSRFCAIRISGSTRRLVCLDGTLARDYAVNVSGGSASLTSMQTQTLTGEARLVISVPSGNDLDVYAITTRGFLVPLFGAPMPDNRTPVCPLAQPCNPEVEDAIAVPACGTQPGRIILRLSTNSGGQLMQMSARGGDLQDFPAPVIPATTVQLDSAGCVDRFEPGGINTQRQVVTYSMGTRNALDEFVPISTRAVYGCNAVTCMKNELLIGAGVTFTEGRMVVSAIDATGVVLVQVVMAPDSVDKDRLVERLRYPAAAAPARIVAGHLDADGDSDLFWNISARRGASFEVAYARQVGANPLEALSPALQVDVADILIGDLTGSGIDSLVFTEATPLATPTAGIAVVPVGAPAQIPASKPDSACN